MTQVGEVTSKGFAYASEKHPLLWPPMDPQATPGCPRDLSRSCASHPRPSDRNRDEAWDVPRDLPSTHHCVSGAAAPLWWRILLLSRDHFKFGGGALCRKRVRGCLREKHLAPPMGTHSSQKQGGTETGRTKCLLITSSSGQPPGAELSSVGSCTSIHVRP